MSLRNEYVALERERLRRLAGAHQDAYAMWATCVHCYQLPRDHAPGGKCLFDSTTYTEFGKSRRDQLYAAINEAVYEMKCTAAEAQIDLERDK